MLWTKTTIAVTAALAVIGGGLIVWKLYPAKAPTKPDDKKGDKSGIDLLAWPAKDPKCKAAFAALRLSDAKLVAVVIADSLAKNDSSGLYKVADMLDAASPDAGTADLALLSFRTTYATAAACLRGHADKMIDKMISVRGEVELPAQSHQAAQPRYARVGGRMVPVTARVPPSRLMPAPLNISTPAPIQLYWSKWPPVPPPLGSLKSRTDPPPDKDDIRVAERVAVCALKMISEGNDTLASYMICAEHKLGWLVLPPYTWGGIGPVPKWLADSYAASSPGRTFSKCGGLSPGLSSVQKAKCALYAVWSCRYGPDAAGKYAEPSCVT